MIVNITNGKYTVELCTSCGWNHEGDEVNGLEILSDEVGNYFVCHLTKHKVYI